MALTPETLTRHELNGLPVRVAAADNPDLVGIVGRVVIETMQTLHVDCGAPRARRLFGVDGDGASRVRQVPKRGVTLEFVLPDDGEPTRTLAGDGGPHIDGEPSTRTDERVGDRPTRTDEAAGGRKAPGSTFKRESETTGVRPGQSGSTREGSPEEDATDSSRADAGDRQDVVYVTVDGATLLSRPAHRTEHAGDSKWR